MKPATLTFIKQRFTQYYKANPVIVPNSIEQREFGYIFFDRGYPNEIRMKRHMSFGSTDELHSYIRSLVPAHVYYGVAYYEHPGAPTMAKKGWSGADLVFDLDADHIMRGSYAAMLSRTKDELISLLDMLIHELGISIHDRKADIVFSGGRGYHLHLKDLAFRGWTSRERRELVDYICGIGISPSSMLRQDGKQKGWPQRYQRTLRSYLTHLTEMGEHEALHELMSLKGVGKITASRFLSEVPFLQETLAYDSSLVLVRDQTIHSVLHALMEKETSFYRQIREIGIQIDEPVTIDTGRLIRLPGSLHAKSGFRVTPLTPHELEDFDPLVDAVCFTDDRDVIIDVRAEYDISLLDTSYHLNTGVHRVPEAVALFMCCRGMAEISDKTLGLDHVT